MKAVVPDEATYLLVVEDSDGDARLRFMAASDETTKFLELFQLEKQDGPCVDAFHSATPVVNTDLGAAGDRWPHFAGQAMTAGFLSVGMDVFLFGPVPTPKMTLRRSIG